MSKTTIKSINTTIENQIATAMIISTKFLSEVEKLFNPEYIKNSFAKIICYWCMDYYKMYKKAPEKHIKDIFLMESDLGMTKEDKEIISAFLTKLSSMYVDEQGINSDYIRDNAFGYFRLRELEIRIAEAQKYLTMGKVEQAEDQITQFKKIAYQTSGWFNPADSKEIMEVFDEQEDGIFKLPGALGSIVGPIERDWFVAVLAPFKRGKCIAKGSQILLPNGQLKSIEQIIKDKDKFVLSKDDSTGKIIKGKITDYYINGLKECFLVKTRLGREVPVTYNHPFFTPNGWIELNKIHVGDFIAVPRQYHNLGTKTFESYKLKLLAYMIAEGCLRGNGSYTFTNKSKKIQNDFKNCVELLGDNINETNDPITVRIVSKKGKGYIGGSNLRKWLTGLEMNQKLTKEKTIPDFIFQLKNEDIALFLSVLFTCDGSVYKDRKNICISYASASKRLIQQVNHLLLRFGIIGKIRENIFRGFHSWEIEFSDMLNIERFLSQIGFRFEKQKQVEKFISELGEKRCLKSNLDAIPYDVLKTIIPEEKPIKNEAVRQCFKKKGKISRSRLPQIIGSYPQIKNIMEDDILWDAITEIIPLGKQETFDLTIEKYHNFIAEDIFVHNTWFLQEMAVRAIFQRLKVVFISLEMKKKNLKERFYKRITGFGSRTGEDIFMFPVFDCELNQLGTCERPERTNQIQLRAEGSNKPDFDIDMEYKPCSYCRDNMLSDYRLETWYEPMEVPQFSFSETKRNIQGLWNMYGDNLRFISYPRFSASLSDIRRDLLLLEQQEQFIPDVIVIDYIDILKPETRNTKEHKTIDDIWKMTASLAAEKHAVLFSASQGTRGSIYKSDMSQDDLAEWIGKLGHVDVFLGLSQTKDEKRSKILRVNGLVHRHKEIDENIFSLLLQQLEVGQFAIDSHIIRR